jgi:hypothetical protein
VVTSRARISVAALALALCPACKEEPRHYSTKADRGTVVFRDDFGRTELGPHWRATGSGASIQDGRLDVENLRNHPVWLTKPLPDDLRVDFDAWSLCEEDEEPEGDIKVELCGDGKSHATSASYVATGYVVIFGGWHNTRNVIARLDEHGDDREHAASPKVEPNRRYHFTITRKGGLLRWELDGREILALDDPAPLVGAGHDHFAFGGWEAHTQFDNLVIEALSP